MHYPAMAGSMAALSKIGYRITRQTGSHLRLTLANPSQQHITIPAHDPLKVGTLSAILSEVVGRGIEYTELHASPHFSRIRGDRAWRNRNLRRPALCPGESRASRHSADRSRNRGGRNRVAVFAAD